MQDDGSKPATAHQAHRTIRVALGEAVRRGHLTVNVAKVAKAPRLEEDEIEPYSVEEVQRLLLAASKRRNHETVAAAQKAHVPSALHLKERLNLVGVLTLWTGWRPASGRRDPGAVGFINH